MSPIKLVLVGREKDSITNEARERRRSRKEDKKGNKEQKKSMSLSAKKIKPDT